MTIIDRSEREGEREGMDDGNADISAGVLPQLLALSDAFEDELQPGHGIGKGA